MLKNKWNFRYNVSVKCCFPNFAGCFQFRTKVPVRYTLRYMSCLKRKVVLIYSNLTMAVSLLQPP